MGALLSAEFMGLEAVQKCLNDKDVKAYLSKAGMGGALKQQKGGKSDNKTDKKADKKAAQEEKAKKAREKLLKASKKEGGKKGQDLEGMSAQGAEFFCVNMTSVDGDWELMEEAMKGMNTKVDPEAEERRGGGDVLGKILFSMYPKQDGYIAYAHMPHELGVTKNIVLKEWIDHVCKAGNATILSADEENIRFEMKNDQDKGHFAMKDRDYAVQAGWDYLRNLNLALNDDSDEGEYVNLADAAGVKWGGGDDDY